MKDRRRTGLGLWLLTRTDADHPQDRLYEVNSAILVRAGSSQAARKMAAAVVIDEPAEVWQSRAYSYCTYIGEAKGKDAQKEAVLLTENNAS